MQDQNFYPNEGNGMDYNSAPEEGVDLADFDSPYDGAERPEGDFPKVSDGNYQANLDRIELTRSKNSGEPMIKWTLRIVGPECKGRLLWRYNVIKHDKERLGYIKKDLYTCGVELEKFSDLPKHFPSMLNTLLNISVQTKGEFQNIYLNGKVVTEDGETPRNFDDDTIPF